MEIIRDDNKWIKAIDEALRHAIACPKAYDAIHIRNEDFERLSAMLEDENLRRNQGRPLIDRPEGFE